MISISDPFQRKIQKRSSSFLWAILLRVSTPILLEPKLEPLSLHYKVGLSSKSLKLYLQLPSDSLLEVTWLWSLQLLTFLWHYPHFGLQGFHPYLSVWAMLSTYCSGTSPRSFLQIAGSLPPIDANHKASVLANWPQILLPLKNSQEFLLLKAHRSPILCADSQVWRWECWGFDRSQGGYRLLCLNGCRLKQYQRRG